MDIIQQKLIWLMGSGIALLLLFRLNLHRAGVDNSILLRLKTGFALILFGSTLGLATTIGVSTATFPEYWQLRFVESVVGYLAGWSLIIFGSFAWARRYFDRKGKPLMAINAGLLSGKISKSLIRGHQPNQMLDAVGDDIQDILSCQAMTLHRISEDRILRLSHALGLTTGSRSLVETSVDTRHMFWRARMTGQAVISDKDLVFRDGSRLESLSGPLTSAISLPVRFNGETIGVLTLYRSQGARFGEDEADLMDIVCDGVGISLANDISMKKDIMESRFREMVALAIRPFENKESLTSALIKSSRIIHGYIPFGKLTLYIHGNGTPQVSDYSLSTGGLVSIASGYFPRKEYPELHAEPSEGFSRDDSRTGPRTRRAPEYYLMAVSEDQNRVAHVRIDLPVPVGKFPYLPLLGESLGRKIAERLKNEKIGALENRAAQWLGALRYYQEKSLAIDNLSEFLREVASLVVEITPVTFCRILIPDRRGRYLKTVGLGQARNLEWGLSPQSGIELPAVACHQKALRTNQGIYFSNSGRSEFNLHKEEMGQLIPDGTSHGLIIPFQMGKRVAGLLSVGEFRNPGRTRLQGETSLFLSSVAGLISMVLTRHLDKRAVESSKEGRRSLTLKKREPQPSPREAFFGPHVRSRINGPLAGIIASCEYLQNSSSDEADVGRFIEIIQRNAVKIHDITAGLGTGEAVPTV